MMKKTNSKKISSKSTGVKEKDNNYYIIPNEACCSAEFSDGCIFSDET
jgi:hypothetical protein